MPLPKRIIEPVYVSRNTLPDVNIEGISIVSELEAVVNGSLANIIRQLSSLSRHAENMFSELSVLSMDIYKRTTNLQTRITRLSVKVTALDSNVEEVSLQDIHMRKAFKSTVVVSQQLFTKESLPAAIREIYNQCDEPPPLSILNPYRDDGKDGLKFYTDPNYFFELWRQEMLNDTERVMQDKGKKIRPKHAALSTTNTLATNEGRQKKRVRQPHNTRERQKQMAMTQGEYFTTPVLGTGTLQPQNVATTSMTVLTKAAGASAAPSTNSIYSDQVIYYGTLKNQQFVNNGSPGAASKMSMRPNSIEFQQHQQHQQQYYSNNLNSNFKQMQLNNSNTTDHYHRPSSSANNGVLINNHNDPNEYIYQQHQMQQQQEPIYGSNQLLSPSRRLRPSQPPPAPPPNQQQQQQQQQQTTLSSPAANHHFISSSAIRNCDPQSTQSTLCEYSSSSIATLNNSNENSNNGAGGGGSNHDILPPPPPPLPPPPPPIHEDDNFSHLESNSYYYDHNGNGHRVSRDHNDSNEMVDGCLESTPPPPPPPPLPPPMPVLGQSDNDSGNGGTESTTTTAQPNKISIDNRPLSRISNGDLLKTISTLSPPKLKPVSANIKAAVPDARNELLQAIRSGIKLRKVEKNEQKSSASTNGQNDVASIMAIRMAVEYSESDSSSQNDDDSEYDSECWAVDDNNAASKPPQQSQQQPQHNNKSDIVK